MNRILISTAVVFVTLIGALLIVPMFIDWNSYKGEIETQAEAFTGYDVTLGGDLSLSVFPSPALSVANVSVKNGSGENAQKFVDLERLDVHVAFMPLLSGKVEVSSISLIAPDIEIVTYQDGSANWQTQKIKEMLSVKIEVESSIADAEQSSQTPNESSMEISLNSLEIEKGRVAYRDVTKGSDVLIEDINTNAKMDSLQGPFSVSGDLLLNGQEIQLDLETGRISDQDNTINILGDIKTDMGKVELSGVASTVEPYAYQGKVNVKADKSSPAGEALGGKSDLGVSGILSASQERIELTDSTIEVAGQSLSGSLIVPLSPMSFQGKFKSEKAINLDELTKMSPSSSGSSKGLDQMVPQNLSLPADINGQVSVLVPGLIYQGSKFESAEVKFSKQRGSLFGSVNIDALPGGGSASAGASLDYKISQESGALINPDVSVYARGEAKQVSPLLTTFVGKEMAGTIKPYLKSETAVFDIKGTLKGDTLVLQESSLQNGPLNVQASGEYKDNGKRPKLGIDVTVNSLDLGELAGTNASSEKTNKKGMTKDDLVKALQLPMDIDFDIGLQKGRYQDYSFDGVRLIGAITENSLDVTTMSVQNFAQSAVNADLKIGDIKGLKQIAVNLKGQTESLPVLLDSLEIDASSLPASAKKAGLNLKAEGSIETLSGSAAVQFAGANITTSGDVANALNNPAVNNLKIDLQHSNAASFFDAVAPSIPHYRSFEKPLSVKTNLNYGENAFSLSNIDAMLGQASIQGKVDLKNMDTLPSMTGDIVFGDLVIQDPVAKPNCCKQAAPSGDIDLGWMREYQLALSVKGNSLVYETWNLKQPSMMVTLENGVLKANNVKAGLYEGQADVSLTAKANAQNALDVDIQSDLSGIQLEPLIGSVTGNKILKGAGLVNVKAALKTTAIKQDDLINNLAGQGTIDGSNIRLDGFDLNRFGRALSEENKPGDTLLGLWKGSIKGGSTEFDTLDGSFAVAKGIVNIQDTVLDGQRSKVVTTGQVNLPSSMINTAHTITLKDREDVPPFTVKINGPLSNPVNTFGQGLLEDYFRRKASRKIESVISDELGGKLNKALGDKLGIPLGGTSSDTQTQETTTSPEPTSGGDTSETTNTQPQQQESPSSQEVTPEDALKGLLRGVLQ